MMDTNKIVFKNGSSIVFSGNEIENANRGNNKDFFMSGLQKYEGHTFKFSEDCNATVIDGIVYIEQYYEGEQPLLHIKTEEDYLNLYKLLTGKELKF